MIYEAYEDWNPRSADTLRTLQHAEDIIGEYQSAGIVMTLRQLYYQFVSRGLIENTERSYKRLGGIVTRGRQSGKLAWDAIEDRARQPVVWSQYYTMEECLQRAMRSFRLPRMAGQDTYVELWVEKDALASVLEPIAAAYHVTLMVNRGYSSASAMRESAERIRDCVNEYEAVRARILYLGDLDPSGEDMVRDIRERGHTFLNGGNPKLQIRYKVTKLALTMDQVEQYRPPPNPTKLTDSRAKGFIDRYGYESWEVDALPPNILRDLITEALEDIIDMRAMQEHIDREKELREEVAQWLQDRNGE